ncbi:MAG: hypothetical protein R3B93_14280 [Bacteroidia bacterium]
MYNSKRLSSQVLDNFNRDLIGVENSVEGASGFKAIKDNNGNNDPYVGMSNYEVLNLPEMSRLENGYIIFGKSGKGKAKLVDNPYKDFFDEAYTAYPNIPEGLWNVVLSVQNSLLCKEQTRPSLMVNRNGQSFVWWVRLILLKYTVLKFKPIFLT